MIYLRKSFKIHYWDKGRKFDKKGKYIMMLYNCLAYAVKVLYLSSISVTSDNIVPLLGNVRSTIQLILWNLYSCKEYREKKELI